MIWKGTSEHVQGGELDSASYLCTLSLALILCRIDLSLNPLAIIPQSVPKFDGPQWWGLTFPSQ
jgi:hypothetical protein